jgi:hypothetical protein
MAPRVGTGSVGETLGKVYTLLFGASLVVAPHGVHHSAEVMTTLVQSAIAGLGPGVLLGTLGPGTKGRMIAGINAFFILANAAKNPFLSNMPVPHDCNTSQ